MEQLPGYDAWLEAPYTNQSEACEHDCSECEGEGTAWDEEKQVAIEDEPCPACKGEGKCDGDCEPDEPDYDDREPEYDE
jgi:hypothetical protein